MNGDDSGIHLFHTLWSVVLSAFGGILAFLGNRAVKQIDQKADKEEVNHLREDLKELRQSQERKHAENTRRLDTIIRQTSRGPK